MLLYDKFHYDENDIGQALTIACKVGARDVVQIILQDAHDIVHK